MLDYNVYAKIGDFVKQYGAATELYKQLGNIKATLDPYTGRFILLNYTNDATYGKTWTDVERACRGLIYDIMTGDPVAIPFPKFFNVNETAETQLEQLPETDFEVTNKLDGSMGILFHDGTQYRIATRGSFTSEQAVWATQYWQQHYSDLHPSGYTLLFEIIYPENQIVLPYGPEMTGLHLIGAVDRHNMRDLSHIELEMITRNTKLPVVPVYHSTNLISLYESLKLLQNIEGFVVRFADGTRVKMKTDDYVTKHKLVSKLTPKTIRELMLLGDSTAIEYIKSIPDELQPLATSYYESIKNRVRDNVRKVKQAYYLEYYAAIDENWKKYGFNDTKSREFRNTFSQRLQQNVPNAQHGLMWSLLNNKSIDAILLKNLDLKELFGDNADADTSQLAVAVE